MTRNSRWCDIPGWEGMYQVSDDGQVRSVDRVDARGRNLKGRVLRHGLSPAGYPIVSLTRNAVGHTYAVHRLVITAFVGPRTVGKECCHRDDDRTNNHLENLYWGTRSENMYDAVRNGRHWATSKTHCKNGHEFDDSNTGLSRRGHRRCRQCGTDRSRRRRAADKSDKGVSA